MVSPDSIFAVDKMRNIKVVKCLIFAIIFNITCPSTAKTHSITVKVMNISVTYEGSIPTYIQCL